MEIFTFEKHLVRFVGTINHPEWVAQDICNIFGIAEARYIMKHFSLNETGECEVNIGTGNSETVLTVTESGLQRLLQQRQVSKKLAKVFQEWIFAQALPSIRQKIEQGLPLTPVEVISKTVETEPSFTSKGWHPEQIEALVKSTKKFPVDFDDAWQWVGYTRKDTAKDLLVANFDDGLDFSGEDRKSTGGRPSKQIYLTTDCFKEFCMMAGTEQGKAVRKYFIQCERIAKRLNSSPLPDKTSTPQLQANSEVNAVRFLQMIEADLEQVGVSKPFIMSWKYGSLKALHPEHAQMFDSAKQVLLKACPEEESPVNVTTISQLIDSEYNLKIPPKYLNQVWVQMGFQLLSSTSKCKWVLTEAGKKYGRCVPYSNNHDGYQVLWLTSIADATFEYLKSQGEVSS